MTVRVKICGIRSDRDLALALEAGADAVGFLVGLDYETDDVLPPEAAAALAREVPPFVTRVVVTHRTTVEEVAELAYAVPCDAVQLHGDFPLDRIALLRLSLPASVRVHRVVAAVDCGTALNPDSVEHQVEGSIAYGLSAALRGEITVAGGAVVQGNFDDQEPLRMHEMPAVEVHIVPSGERPGGVGEPGVPPVAPAVANAVFALTGRRLRDLPLALK